MISYGFHFAGTFAKSIESAVDTSIAAIEDILAEGEINAEIDLTTGSNGTIGLSVEVREQDLEHALIVELEEAITELGFMSNEGIVVESIYDEEETIEYYGFPNVVEDLRKSYQPIGVEHIMAEEDDCYSAVNFY